MVVMRLRRRHSIIWFFIRLLVTPFLWFKFGYTFKVARNLPDNYIVLSNHATDYDPLLVGVSFPRQMYLVASEHIARWKRAFKYIDYAFAPIMRYKGTVATSTVVEVLRRVRKGANVCIFAEGARTWDGVTGPILPSTAKLVKNAGCGLVTYKIVGGHFISPMWSGSNTRRGYSHGEVVNVYTKEQLASMTQQEVYEAINRDLFEDAYARQLADPKPYRGKGLAEGLENLLFICPQCHAHDTLVTAGDTITCKGCGLVAKYNEYAALNHALFPTVKALSDWQKEQIAADLANHTVYSVPQAQLLTVRQHKETPVTEGAVTMTGEWLCCGEVRIAIADISDMAMHGKRALVFTANNEYYEITTSDNVNMLKFWLLYQEIRNKVTVTAVSKKE